jgi:phosphate uptake regulator
MKRKLVKQGAATLMVSIPSKWAKKFNLDKGDEIDIEEKGNSLILGVEERKRKNEITVQLTKENKNEIYPILTHAYRLGFNKIILTGEVHDVTREISSLTNKLLIGFEVIERGKDKITLENVSEPSNEKFDSILSKIFLIIKDTQDLIIGDFKIGEFKNLTQVEESKDQIDRFVLFCRRLMSKGLPEKNITLEWEFMHFIMNIGHTSYYLYEYASKNKIKPEKEMTELLSELQGYTAILVKSYMEKNIPSVLKINALKYKFQFGKCIKAIESSKGSNAVIYAYIKEIFRIVQLAGSPVLSGIFEKKFEEA